MKKKGPSIADLKYNDSTFIVESPPRPSSTDAADWADGAMLCPFWWIGTTSDKSLTTVSPKMIKLDDVAVTVFTNTRGIKKGEKLVRCKETEVKAKPSVDSFAVPPAKKAKTQEKANTEA